jgi:uncharacterized membrane protein
MSDDIKLIYNVSKYVTGVTENWAKFAFMTKLNYTRFKKYPTPKSSLLRIGKLMKKNKAFAEINANKIAWKRLTETWTDMPEDFMEKYADKLGWDNISKRPGLSEAFIEKHVDKVKWSEVIQYQVLSEAFMAKHKTSPVSEVVKYQHVSEAYINEHIDEIDSILDVFEHQQVSDAFIREHITTFEEFSYAQMYQKLSVATIEKHIDAIDWSGCISCNKYISEDILDKYYDLLDIGLLCSHRILSDAFIEKHKDTLEWGVISNKWDMTTEFVVKYDSFIKWYFINNGQKSKKLALPETLIWKHFDNLSIQQIFKYPKISETFIEKCIDRIDSKNIAWRDIDKKIAWFLVSKYQTLSLSFIEKHITDLYMKRILRYQNVSIALVSQYSCYHNAVKKNKIIAWTYAFISKTGISHDLSLPAELAKDCKYTDIKVKFDQN